MLRPRQPLLRKIPSSYPVRASPRAVSRSRRRPPACRPLTSTRQPNRTSFESLIELPALQGSTGRTTNTFSTSSGIQGLSSLSLRGLGTLRTLTLLDGQRVVGANVTGVTDVSQFPQLLVKRVDVVTGGASASYGSDAIGGVVNFITDKKFTGFKANVAGGKPSTTTTRAARCKPPGARASPTTACT
jgi:iron complex outermembrane receptor protein